MKKLGAYTRSGPVNTCAKSLDGYMDTDLYLNWYNKLYASKECLLLDGHKSHILTELIDQAWRWNNHYIYLLMPHVL